MCTAALSRCALVRVTKSARTCNRDRDVRYIVKATPGHKILFFGFLRRVMLRNLLFLVSRVYGSRARTIICCTARSIRHDCLCATNGVRNSGQGRRVGRAQSEGKAKNPFCLHSPPKSMRWQYVIGGGGNKGTTF